MSRAIRRFALAFLLSTNLGFAQDTMTVLSTKIDIGNPDVGRSKAQDERCTECHGQNGLSGDARIPHHAGQHARYLIKQLQDFQSGARTHDIMNRMTQDLEPNDMADIAAYFASQPSPSNDAAAADKQAGRELFLHGDPGRQIPACANCHGANAKGGEHLDYSVPSLAGQRKVYLRSQLVNWKLGERHNSPNGVMNDIANQLNAPDIDALVDYLSGL